MIITKDLLFLGKKEFTYNDRVTKQPKQFNVAFFWDSKDIDTLRLSYDEIGRFNSLSFGDSISLELKVMPDGKNFKYFIPKEN